MVTVEAWKREIARIQEELENQITEKLPINLLPQLRLELVRFERNLSAEEIKDRKNKLTVVFYQRMHEFWVKEKEKFWPKEYRKVPIPVRLERARTRMDPYLQVWQNKKYQIQIGASERSYPLVKHRGMIRRVVDWEGTVIMRDPIHINLPPARWFPLYLPQDIFPNVLPEEMKWWLDGVKARHAEFEPVAVEEVMEKVGDKNLYKEPVVFKLLVEKKRKEWDTWVKKWVKEPMTVFKNMFIWNHPTIVQQREQARKQRDKAYKEILRKCMQDVPPDWYEGSGVQDPLREQPDSPEKETEEDKKKRHRYMKGELKKAEKQLAVPKHFLWMVNPEDLAEEVWTANFL